MTGTPGPTRALDLVAIAGAVVIGIIGLAVGIFVAARGRGAKSYVGIPTMLLASSYAVAALCEALLPLYAQPIALTGGPTDRLRGALFLANDAGLSVPPVVDLLLFAGAGALLVMAAGESGLRRPWSVVIAAAGATAAAHVAHGALGLSIHWEVAVAHIVGLAAGAWAARRWLGAASRELRGARRARMGIAAYATLLALWGLRPFGPESSGAVIVDKLTADRLIPFRALADRFGALAAFPAVQQFALYLPLGAVLAVWPLRRNGPLSGAWPAVYLAALIEALHVVVAGRQFDITTALMAWAGVGIGWLIVRRADYPVYGAAWPEPSGNPPAPTARSRAAR